MLPYVGHMSDAMAHIICKAGVAVHLPPFNTIQAQLVHPKDKVAKKGKTGVVYHIQCDDCGVKYVGETERSLKKHMTEHQPLQFTGWLYRTTWNAGNTRSVRQCLSSPPNGSNVAPDQSALDNLSE